MFFNKSNSNNNNNNETVADKLRSWTPACELKKKKEEEKTQDPIFSRFEAVKAEKLAKLEALKKAKKDAEEIQHLAEERTLKMKQGIQQLEAIKADAREVENHLREQEANTAKALDRNAAAEAAFLAYLEDESSLDQVAELLKEKQPVEAAPSEEVSLSEEVEEYFHFFESEVGYEPTETPTYPQEPGIVQGVETLVQTCSTCGGDFQEGEAHHCQSMESEALQQESDFLSGFNRQEVEPEEEEPNPLTKVRARDLFPKA